MGQSSSFEAPQQFKSATLLMLLASVNAADAEAPQPKDNHDLLLVFGTAAVMMIMFAIMQTLQNRKLEYHQ